MVHDKPGVGNPVIRGFYPDPSVCRKGEDFYLAVKSANEGYLNREFFHKGDSIITYGHCVEVAVHVAPEKIPTYVKNRILDRYDMFHY